MRGQKTTGFLVMRGGRTLAEENWPAPDDRMFAIFLYGKAADGALFEDVASQQKSFVSVLVGVAIDKGLIDVDKPVSDYLGVGRSEEHTSDLQSLMRISYAVFCLTKKNIDATDHKSPTT